MMVSLPHVLPRRANNALSVMEQIKLGRIFIPHTKKNLEKRGPGKNEIEGTLAQS